MKGETMSNIQQIQACARFATGLIRLARKSREPGKLVEDALRRAERLTDVARTLTDDREAMMAYRASGAVESMINASFGVKRLF